MRSFRHGLTLAAACLGLAACTSTPPTIILRSLEASEKTSPSSASGGNETWRNIDDCPDTVPFDLDHEDRYLYTLVTQRTRGEVALVDPHPRRRRRPR